MADRAGHPAILGARAAAGGGIDTTLTAALWNATTTVVVTACQANNSFGGSGAVGYLDDPRACTTGASLDICGAPTAMASPNCLTAQQAAAIDKIWAGPHNGYDNSGRRIWFPNNKGVTGGVVSFTAPQSSTAQVMAWDQLRYECCEVVRQRENGDLVRPDERHPLRDRGPARRYP